MDIHERTFVWQLTYCCADLCLWFWTRQDRKRFYVSSATMVIKISRVHTPVVKPVDCRSAGPWFNSWRRTWSTFMMWCDKLTNPDLTRINIMSPITTSIRTITRKSVNMVAELDNGTALWTVRGIGHSLECNPVVTKVLHAIALKTPSRFGADAVVDWMQWSGAPILAGGPTAGRMSGRLIGESLDRLGNPTFRLGLYSEVQTQEQHIQLHEDQLTTDTADLMTEEALAEDATAFEDITQDCLVCQTKFVEFKAYNKSLSEGLEALAKAKAVIYEKTGDAEYQDNRSVLSSRGGLAGEPKGKHSIELVQLASRVDSVVHGEISNDDDPFAKVKGLISDMIARLEEKASADATHNATSNVYTAVHRTDGSKTIAKRVQGVSQLFSFLDETYYPEESETEMMRYMTMLQHKDLSLTVSMISLGPGIMKLNLVVYLASYIGKAS